MNRVLKCIERIMQVLTIIGGIWTAVEAVKMFMYEKQLRERADSFLDDELELEGNIRGAIKVQSPTLVEKKEQVSKLLVVTSIGAIISIVLNLVNRLDD